MSRVYDSWERLVGAVLDREKLRQLALFDSFDSSISAATSSSSHQSHEDVFATRASSEVISPSIFHDALPIEFNELKKATRNFGNLIWSGVVFDVYKGWIDEETLIASKPGFGMPVAVKMWVNRKGREELLRKIHYLSQLHHPNLVKLVGHCSEIENRYFLVYEFMPKGSLDNHLFGREHQTLSWVARIKVATDAARALSYLHDKDKPVIEWNVKSSHVLLDGELNAKLCGFSSATDVTWVTGSSGYAAPKYIARDSNWTRNTYHARYLTTKCNVYSFGVVMLELLSGRQSINMNLADWAKPYLRNKKTVLMVMDPRLEGQYSSKEVYDVANVALQCLSRDPEKRPRMAEVLLALKQVQKKI